MDTNHLQPNTYLQNGKYRIVRFIASGGFGCTYEAEHVMLRKRIAIKELFVKDVCVRQAYTQIITADSTSKKGFVQKLTNKFMHEARALAMLNHPNIVNVTDVFQEYGTAYYVMDYIDGMSLAQIVKLNGTLPEVNAVNFIRQTAEALAYVHANGLLHLDVKPANIMVDRKGNAILIDFGVSKQYEEDNGHTTSSLLGMTPGFAPPEQMSNNAGMFTQATDVYALGATLYNLLTGRAPLNAAMLICGETNTPLPTTISKKTRSAVYAAMRLNIKERPQTMREFIACLNGKSSIRVANYHIGFSLVRNFSRHKATTIAAFVFLIVVAVIIYFSNVGNKPVDPPQYLSDTLDVVPIDTMPAEDFIDDGEEWEQASPATQEKSNAVQSTQPKTHTKKPATSIKKNSTLKNWGAVDVKGKTEQEVQEEGDKVLDMIQNKQNK